MEAYDGPQIVGMDLHRRRSVLVRMTEDGRKLSTAKISNSPARLTAEIRRAGPRPKVVLEACNGWYWAADALAAAGADVHLAHPLGVKAFRNRRVKNGTHEFDKSPDTEAARASSVTLSGDVARSAPGWHDLYTWPQLPRG